MINAHFAAVASHSCQVIFTDLLLLLDNHLLTYGCLALTFSDVALNQVVGTLERCFIKSLGIAVMMASPHKCCIYFSLLSLLSVDPLLITRYSRVYFLITKSELSSLPHLKVKNVSILYDTWSIALLPALYKLFKWLAHDQFSDFLESNNLLDLCKFGFRHGFRTQFTLQLSLIEPLQKNIYRGHVILLVLFDYSEAFNSVQHDVVLEKLRVAGCGDGPICWLFIP